MACGGWPSQHAQDMIASTTVTYRVRSSHTIPDDAPLCCSINITLAGCCDHLAIVPDEALDRHAANNISRADSRLLGRQLVDRVEVCSGAVAMRYVPRP